MTNKALKLKRTLGLAVCRRFADPSNLERFDHQQVFREMGKQLFVEYLAFFSHCNSRKNAMFFRETKIKYNKKCELLVFKGNFAFFVLKVQFAKNAKFLKNFAKYEIKFCIFRQRFLSPETLDISNCLGLVKLEVQDRLE